MIIILCLLVITVIIALSLFTMVLIQKILKDFKIFSKNLLTNDKRYDNI